MGPKERLRDVQERIRAAKRADADLSDLHRERRAVRDELSDYRADRRRVVLAELGERIETQLLPRLGDVVSEVLDLRRERGEIGETMALEDWAEVVITRLEEEADALLTFDGVPSPWGDLLEIVSDRLIYVWGQSIKTRIVERIRDEIAKRGEVAP